MVLVTLQQSALQACGFLFIVWLAGRGARLVGIVPAVGELVVGGLLGPWAACLVPWAGCEADADATYTSQYSNAFVIAGHVGVTLVMMQSAMHVDVEAARVGVQSVSVALLGVAVPVAVTLAVLGPLAGFDLYSDAFAAAVVLAPTSLEVAFKFLGDAKQLNSDVAQVVVNISLVDEAVALVLLTLVMRMGVGEAAVAPVVTVVRVIAAMVLIALSWLAAKRAWCKRGVDAVLSRIPTQPTAWTRRLSEEPKEDAQMALMLATLVACVGIGHLIGCHLVGAFVAGILFSNVPMASVLWTRRMDSLVAWLLRMFYAATLGFALPGGHLFTAKAIGYGALLSFLGCFCAKFAAGAFTCNADRWVIGSGMVPRGELAYYTAIVAAGSAGIGTIASAGSGATAKVLLSPPAFATLCWALVSSSVVAPFVFAKLLRHYASHHRPRSQSRGRSDPFTIRIEGMHHKGVVTEVMGILGRLNLEVNEAVIETDGDVDVQMLTVLPTPDWRRSPTSLTTLRSEILAAFDNDAQVVIMGAEDINTKMLEIQVTCSHHPALFSDVTQLLQELHLDVSRCQLSEYAHTDVEVFYAVNMDNPPSLIGNDVKDTVKRELKQLLLDANVDGEVLVKHPRFSQMPSHMNPASPHLLAGQGLMKVVIQAQTHHPRVLWEAANQLRKLHLDVVSAEMETGDTELAVFYVRALDDTGRQQLDTPGALKAALVRAIHENDCRVEVAGEGGLSPMHSNGAGGGAGAGVGAITVGIVDSPTAATSGGSSRISPEAAARAAAMPATASFLAGVQVDDIQVSRATTGGPFALTPDAVRPVSGFSRGNSEPFSRYTSGTGTGSSRSSFADDSASDGSVTPRSQETGSVYSGVVGELAQAEHDAMG